jgi:hypothetical protein
LFEETIAEREPVTEAGPGEEERASWSESICDWSQKVMWYLDTSAPPNSATLVKSDTLTADVRRKRVESTSP